MSGLDRLIARLRELALATPTALATGLPPASKREVLAAFAEDIALALRDADAHAREIARSLSEGPTPLTFASATAKARRASAAERGAAWRERIETQSEAAYALARLYAAAGPLVAVLLSAEAAAGLTS